MVTPAEVERYSVQAINTDNSLALSHQGDVGDIVCFYDDDGDGCGLPDAEFAIVHWRDVDFWTTIRLRDYQSTKLH